MNQDQRNSFEAWASVLVLIGGLWLALHFDLLGPASDWFSHMLGDWETPITVIVIVLQFAFLTHGFWQRRASNPNNPNRA